ncbi:MAG: 16S rRNA (uracil(1498)-N(3))-methyltransferase [Veillonellales bacterium]
MRHFFIDMPLQAEVAITGADVRHIRTVLRLQAGDIIIVTDPDGQTGAAKITQLLADRVTLALQELLPEDKEAPIRVFLAQGLPKNDKMDYIVQKTVELGIAGIYPLLADHSVVQYSESKGQARVERWRKIAAEAAKQCGRSMVPAVNPIQRLPEILNHHAADSTVIMLYEGECPLGLKEVLVRRPDEKYVLLVGPEGGFSRAEVMSAREHDVQIASMGPRILRTETAAVAAVAAVMYEQGDLGGG